MPLWLALKRRIAVPAPGTSTDLYLWPAVGRLWRLARLPAAMVRAAAAQPVGQTVAQAAGQGMGVWVRRVAHRVWVRGSSGNDATVPSGVNILFCPVVQNPRSALRFT